MVSIHLFLHFSIVRMLIMMIAQNSTTEFEQVYLLLKSSVWKTFFTNMASMWNCGHMNTLMKDYGLFTTIKSIMVVKNSHIQTQVLQYI